MAKPRSKRKSSDDPPSPGRSIRPSSEAVVLFVVLTACALFGSLLTSYVAESLLKDEMRGDAKDVARAALLAIDPDSHQRILSGGQMWTDEHKAALAPLAAMHAQYPSLTRLRTVTDRGGQLVVVLDTETVAGEVGLTRPVEPIEIGQALPATDEAEAAILQEAIRTREAQAEGQSEPTQYYGTFLSGAAPMADGRSAVEAELNVAAKESALDEVQAWARAGGAIAIFASAIVAVIFFNIRSAHLAAVTSGREVEEGHAWLRRRNETLVKAFGQIVLHRNLDDDFLLWDGDTESPLGRENERMPVTLIEWLAQVHPEDRDRVEKLVAAVGPELPSYEIEYRVRHLNGSWRWVLERGALTVGEAGDTDAVDSVLLDITSRKLEQDERAALALIAGRTDNGVCLLDRRGVVEWSNAAFERITGFASSDAREVGLLELLGAPASESDLRVIIDSALGGEGRTSQVLLKRAGGSTYWAELEIQPLTDESGRISQLVAIQSDITDAKEFEQRLVEARDAAQAGDQAKSEFLAVMSHEIRTPLNSVIGFTNLLLETGLSDQQRDYIETIRSSGDNLLILINDILDFSKVEANSVRLASEPFNLRQCVEDTLDVLAQNAALKEIELISDIAPSVPEVVVGDRARFRQVLLNLAGNAVKFTSEGEVAIGIRTLGDIDGRTLLRIEVRDTGPGIDPAQQNRLFKPFSQVDSSATRKFGGTGLGLAISKSLISLMDGTMNVDSEPGRGSTFWIEVAFPVAPPAAPSGPDVKPLDGLRVLLAEKNSAQRQALTAQLVQWGMQVESCRRGREAIYSADHRRFDVALVDAALPDIDAVGLADRLRRTPRGGAGTVVLMAPATLLPSLPPPANGLLHHLRKPIHRDALAEILLRASLRTAGVAAAPQPASEQSSNGDHATTSGTTAARNTPTPADAIAGTGARVLVADDNAINRKLINKILAKLGHQPHVVTNGLECLDAIQAGTYDVILMDVQMPEMDGLTATRRIRELGLDLPIVALTANAMPEDRKRCMEAGMTDYLSKPIRAEALAEAIERFAHSS